MKCPYNKFKNCYGMKCPAYVQGVARKTTESDMYIVIENESCKLVEAGKTPEEVKRKCD